MFHSFKQMTGNWRTRSTNNSIFNSFSGDLLFVYFVLFSSFSLVFPLSGLLLNPYSGSLPAVNVGAWISCSEATIRGVLWKKVSLQNTSGRLLLLVVGEEAAVDSSQADKTVFEKENSIYHSQKILDKFHMLSRYVKPCWKKMFMLNKNLIGY